MPILKEPLIKQSSTILTNKLRIRPSGKAEFLNWQAKLNTEIASFPGFVSLEILTSAERGKHEWIIVQRFSDSKALIHWYESDQRRELIEEVEQLLLNGEDSFIEEDASASDLDAGVTEVFITQINPEKEKAYQAWISKIHQVEAKFPGFRGCYVQSPRQTGGRNWITLLQFDTPENLDRWLKSSERQQVLQESKPLISSIESHRVISPFAGWFSSIAKESGVLPPVWKQTMLILLVLFPIVMLELKFLSPLTASLNRAFGTFISNAISVSLIAWPAMPLAIWLLGWWLVPEGQNRARTTIIGTAVVLGLYLAELILLWNFL